jgi:hypothetical protein
LVAQVCRSVIGSCRELTRGSIVVLVLVLGAGCGGDAPSGPVTQPEPEPPVTPPPPTTPVISAPARLKAGLEGTATIPTQANATYAWTITGGEIVTGASSTQITFRGESPGEIRLSATATNQAGQTSEPGEATVRSFTTLTVLLSGDVTGSPAAGETEHEAPEAVALSYEPAAGASRVIVESNGVVIPASDEVVMDRHRTLWVYAEPATGETFRDMVVVPADPTIVPYPDFYGKRASVDIRVADPYCGVKRPTVAYPKSYLGEFPLPAPTGTLPAGLGRGVALKDYWAYIIDNPTTNEGCSSSWHAAVEETLRRVKRLGADHVAIYQNAYLLDANSEQLKFDCMNDVGCPSWAQIPDREIRWAAARARDHGLELHLYMQVDVHDLNNSFLPQEPSVEWLGRYFDAYREYILHQGQLAQEAGVSMMQMDWGVWWIDWARPEYKAIFHERMAEIATALRTVYSGTRALGVTTPWHSGDAALMAQTDLLLLELWMIRFNVTEQENANLSVPLLRAKYAQLIRDLAGALGSYNKPTLFRVSAQSHRDYLLHGWVEDGFCSPGCPQQDLKVDFSIQAMSHQAQFEAITAQTSFLAAAVHVNGYWFADNMLPRESFPNMSQSFRNKPAESVVYHWFSR